MTLRRWTWRGRTRCFANNGIRLSPILLRSVRTSKGDVIANYNTDQKPVMDPRIAYVMTNMMEGVINNGLGYTAVRLRGFTPPAAGKTGSSHDGWFAGYTSNLLCIVWVGYDDYSDLRLSGAQTAAPIWAEFMKKAATLPMYSDMREFSQPSGVVDVQLDKADQSAGDTELHRRLHFGVCSRDRAARYLRDAAGNQGLLYQDVRGRQAGDAGTDGAGSERECGPEEEKRVLRQDCRNI